MGQLPVVCTWSLFSYLPQKKKKKKSSSAEMFLFLLQKIKLLQCLQSIDCRSQLFPSTSLSVTVVTRRRCWLTVFSVFRSTACTAGPGPASRRPSRSSHRASSPAKASRRPQPAPRPLLPRERCRETTEARTGLGSTGRVQGPHVIRPRLHRRRRGRRRF